ncbi:MAG: hypothetical protein V3R25_05690 [Nitrosomonadaceae bacterium]
MTEENMKPEEVVESEITRLKKEGLNQEQFLGGLTEGQRIIKALNEAGYVIVPKEPTRKMLEMNEFVPLTRRQIYKAMIEQAND